MPNRRRSSSYQLLKLLETTGKIGELSLNLRTGEMNISAGVSYITGLSQNESLHGLFDHLLHPDDRRALGELFDMLYSGRALDHTVRIVRSDRTMRWVTIKAQIIVDAEHRPARAEGIVFDVTAPHEARLLAEQIMARYRGIVDMIAAVVWTMSPEGHARPSPDWQALTGQSALEMQGDGWLNAIHPEDRPATEAAWRGALASATSYELKHRILRADGTIGWFSTHATPLHHSDGSVREWVGIMLEFAHDPSSSPVTLLPSDITGMLVRGARAILNWSVDELSNAAGVSIANVRRVEEDVRTIRPQTREAIHCALKAAGVSFVAAPDGRTGLMTVTSPAI